MVTAFGSDRSLSKANLRSLVRPCGRTLSEALNLHSLSSDLNRPYFEGLSDTHSLLLILSHVEHHLPRLIEVQDWPPTPY